MLFQVHLLQEFDPMPVLFLSSQDTMVDQETWRGSGSKLHQTHLIFAPVPSALLQLCAAHG